MKHFKIYKIITSIFVFVVGINIAQPVLCQSREEMRAFRASEESKFVFRSYITDRIYWKDRYYLCDISPLSVFADYKNIYPNPPKSDELLEEGMSIPIDKYYDVYWIILNDSTLYLTEVKPYCLSLMSADDIKMRHLQIEKLTGLRFQNLPLQVHGIKKNEHGILKAEWFSGRIYLKRDIDNETDDNIIKYYREPFYKLQFKKGKIVKIEKVCRMEPN